MTTKVQMQELRREHSDTLTHLHKVEAKIEKAKAECGHAWQYIGHGHNDSYYECLICNTLKTE